MQCRLPIHFCSVNRRRTLAHKKKTRWRRRRRKKWREEFHFRWQCNPVRLSCHQVVASVHCISRLALSITDAISANKIAIVFPFHSSPLDIHTNRYVRYVVYRRGVRKFFDRLFDDNDLPGARAIHCEWLLSLDGCKFHPPKSRR